MAVGDIYLVTVEQELHGQTILNTCHYLESASGGSGGAALLAAGIDSRIGSVWKPVMSDEWHYTLTQAQKVYPTPPQYPVQVGTNSGDGAVGTPAANTSDAIVFTKRTALAGRKYRGRFYIAGYPNTYQFESAIESTSVATMTPLGAALVGTYTNGTYTFDPVLFHRSDNTNTAIAATVLRTTIRNQRRRQLRKGI